MSAEALAGGVGVGAGPGRPRVPLDFGLDEYAERLERVRRSMEERGLDALIVTDPANMAWLTGYDGWSFYVHQCVVLGPSGEPVWYGRAMDRNGALRTCWIRPENMVTYPDSYVQNPDTHPMDHLCREVLAERGWAGPRTGVEMDTYYFTARAYQRLEAGLPEAELVDAEGLVNWCRAVKSPAEIEYMRVAGHIVENIHAMIRETIEPGLPKNRLVGEIYRVACEGHQGRGGDYPAIVPLLPTGEDASAPHLTWDDRPFEEGDNTFFEVAGCHKRYHCPLARTVHLGPAPERLVRAESALIAGLEAGLGAARPGNTCADVAHALEAEMRRHGVDRGGTRCGYSVGLAYPPDWGEHTMSLREADRTVLRPGMTFHFMPGVWQDDWGLEITETILIGEAGAEALCDVPRELYCKQ